MMNAKALAGWQDRAACRGKPIEFFFGDAADADRNAALEVEGRRVCNGCPVREECFAWALSGGRDVYGMWGGTTKTEREKLLRHIRRSKCPVCVGENLVCGDPGDAVQVCCDCGHSWTTMRPSTHARLNADAA